MKRARDVMTTEVLTIAPDMPLREVARQLLERGVSAAPVVDGRGKPLGMVSEGDIIGRDDTTHRERRDWWLAMVAEGESLNPEFLASFEGPHHRARDVMSAPVVTVTPDTDVAEIARLLAEFAIKRVPVVLDNRVVGVVSRADLLRALADEHPARTAPHDGGHGILGALGGHLLHPHHEAPATAPAPEHEAVARPSAADFRALVSDHGHAEAAKRAAEREAAAAQRRVQVKELIDHHVGDEAWQAMLHKAREAAERGEPEALIFRFPAPLCSDGGRAINVPEDDWPTTLRGEAAEIYLRWQRELQPQGFHLAARVLDFPGGTPGDIGFFLVWGK